MKSDSSNQHEEPHRDSLPVLKELLEQTRLLAEIRRDVELGPCLLDKIGRIACLTANEVHQNTLQLKALRQSLEALVEMYRTVNPAAALELDRLGKLRAEIERCCPPEDACETICHYVPCKPLGGIRRGDGYSMKSRGSVLAVPYSERPHAPWKIVPRVPHEADENLPPVPLGPIVGPDRAVGADAAAARLPQRRAHRRGRRILSTFRTFTEDRRRHDDLAARHDRREGRRRRADVRQSLVQALTRRRQDVHRHRLHQGLRRGQDLRRLGGRPRASHYVPAIDCFVLYVQSNHTGSNPNKNVVKVAVASPADLKTHKGGKRGVAAAVGFHLGHLRPRRLVGWTSPTSLTTISSCTSSPTRSPARTSRASCSSSCHSQSLKAGGTIQLPVCVRQRQRSPSGRRPRTSAGRIYWAAHVNNSTMRIYSSRGPNRTYAWRERTVNNWPMCDEDGAPDIVSAAPDSSDWVSTDAPDHRCDPRQQPAVVRLDRGRTAMAAPAASSSRTRTCRSRSSTWRRTSSCVEQMQVWNADHAYTYPSLTTNSDNEVGISLAWGGGT